MSKAEVKRLDTNMTERVYLNIKTNKAYKVLNVGINKTNSQDGEIMVAYKRYDNRMVYGQFFYREVNEFFKKFCLLRDCND